MAGKPLERRKCLVSVPGEVASSPYLFLKQRRRRYGFLLVGLFVLAVVATADLRRAAQPLPTARIYASYCWLLIPPSTRYTLNTLSVSTGEGDLAFWLSSDMLFERLLDRRGVYDKAEKRLALKFPALFSRFHQVSVRGIEREDFTLVGQPAAAAATSLSYADMFAPGTSPSATDSAEDSGVASAGRVRRRVNRIVLQCLASRPEDSQQLAANFVQVLSGELELVSTQRARARIVTIRQRLASASKRLTQLAHGLQRHAGADPDNEKKLERQASALSLQQGRLRGLIADARGDLLILDEGGGGSAANLGQALAAAEQEMFRAEQVLTPNSWRMVQLRAKVGGLRRAQALIVSAMKGRRETAVRFKIAGLLQRLERVDQELAALRKAEVSEKDRRTFEVMTRESSMWETEMLSWEGQLLEARIEERLCKGEGTVVQLQPPQPGKLQSVYQADFMARFRRTFRILPLVPGATLLLFLLEFGLAWIRRVESRVVKYVDAPILAVFPELSDRRTRPLGPVRG